MNNRKGRRSKAKPRLGTEHGGRNGLGQVGVRTPHDIVAVWVECS